MRKVKIFNDEKVIDQELSTYTVRKSVRIVILNDKNEIAVLFSPTGDYYVLPGGGVDDGETEEIAALRESAEEASCKVEIICTLGRTKECRKETKTINYSAGYLVKKSGLCQSTVGSKSDTVEERESVIKWVTVDEAIKLLKKSCQNTKNLYNRYSHLRDIYFLSKYAQYLDQNPR